MSTASQVVVPQAILPWNWLRLRPFLLYSTIFGLFSGNLYLKVGFDLLLIYPLIALNLLLFALISGYALNRGLLLFYLYLGVTGAFGVANGTSSVSRVLSQFGGIALMSFYHYNFLRLQRFDFLRLFHLYSTVAFWVTCASLISFPIRYFLHLGYVAVYWPMQEPQHFVAVMFPAAFYFWYRAAQFNQDMRKATIFVVALLFGYSSTGFLGMLLSVAFLTRKIQKRLVIIVPLIAALAVGLYFSVENFRDRVNSFTTIVQSGDIGEVSTLSAYIYFTNAFVTYEVVSRDPVLGNGLGSHFISHDRYLGADVRQHEFSEFSKENAADANSMFLRILSEQGLLGLGLAIWFLVRYFPKGASEPAFIARGIFIYCLLILLREGHYFRPEFYFFLLGYVCLHKLSLAETSAPATDSVPAPAR